MAFLSADRRHHKARSARAGLAQPLAQRAPREFPDMIWVSDTYSDFESDDSDAARRLDPRSRCQCDSAGRRSRKKLDLLVRVYGDVLRAMYWL